MPSQRPKQITRAFLIVVIFCSVSAFPQQQSETYDWPLKPGMVEWKYPSGEVHPCSGRADVLTLHGEDGKSYVASNAISRKIKRRVT